MDRGKKLLSFLAIVVLVTMSSCLCAPEPAEVGPGPVVVAPKPETPTTTSTTLPPQVAVVATTPEVPVVSVPAAPSISEVDLRNLFGRANSLRNDVAGYSIAEVLPAETAAAERQFAVAKPAYDSAIDASPYDGVAAWPVKEKLETSIANYTDLLDRGLPLRVAAERKIALEKKALANGANARVKAPERMTAADQSFADAEKLESNKTWPMAIDEYKQSAIMYEISSRRAVANEYRDTIFSNGYAKYSANYFDIAEKKYAEEGQLWESGTPADLEKGSGALAMANSYYSEVAARGRAYTAWDHKAIADAAKKQSDELNAEVNAPDEYASAMVNYGEGESNLKDTNFETATLWYDDATQGFGQAYDMSFAKSESAEIMIAKADEAVAAADEKASYAKMADNPYLKLAKDYKANADLDFSAKYFDAASNNAQKSIDYASLSDSYVDGKITKAQADAKIAADSSLAKARGRMAWANGAGIKTDYPTEYKNASSAMTAAEISYGNENYVPAKANADEVVSILSTDFEAKVAADRAAKAAAKAAAEKAAADKLAADIAAANAKAEAERLAAEKAASEKAAALQAQADLEASKAAADISLAKARERMAWADGADIKADYPDEYKGASSAMTAAEIAYGSENYVPAKANADEVVSILSADFEAKVAADRSAKAAAKAAADKAAADKLAAEIAAANAKAEAERLAAEKAAAERAAALQAQADLDASREAADISIAKARERMAWANGANIKADYPVEHKNASAAMTAAEIAYDNENYVPAKANADEVVSILSADFEAKVAADRAAKAAAKAAADKAAADKLAAELAEAKAQAEAQRLAAEKAAADRLAADKAAAEAKAEADRLAAEKAAADKLIADMQIAQAKADAEKAAAEKAAALKAQADLDASREAADLSIAKARERMAWANGANIKADYPVEHKNASAAMTAAEIAYDNENYVPAKANADEVVSILSADFEAKVAADRAAKAAAKAAADKAAADKLAAELAQAKAQAEAQRLAAEKAAADKAAADKLAAEMASARANAEADRLAAELAAAKAKAEADRLAAEMAAAKAKAEADRLAAEKAAADAKAEADRLAAEKAAADKLIADMRIAQAKAEAERAAAEKAAAIQAQAELDASKEAAEVSLAKARERMAWANGADIKTEYPTEYKKASAAMTAAEIAYGNENYVPAKANADEVVSILSADFEARVAADRAAKAAAKAAADKAAADKLAAELAQAKAQAEAQRLAAEKAAADKAAADKAAADRLAAEMAAAKARAEADKLAADKAAAERLAALKSDAQSSLVAAQQRYGWASAYNAENNYPAEFGAATGYLKSARAASKAEDWTSTKDNSLATIEALKNVSETAPLPASYTVRLIPARRDCLWRIAEYSFVYNNPLKWPVLYEANKKTFKDPSNPNLIYPGQVLVIPSIAGETRKDMWSSAKTYAEFPKKK